MATEIESVADAIIVSSSRPQTMADASVVTSPSTVRLPDSPAVSECFSYESSPPHENPRTVPTETRRRPSILAKSSRDDILRKILLASRILGLLFSLISLSVLAADRSQGWALDSFYRYRELRYCLSVNAIAFLYSALQLISMAYAVAMGIVRRSRYRYLVDFCVDQMVAYLLISASSSGSYRVEDWEMNWGKDEFAKMAKASLAFSYLSFVSFASASLVSGYTLISRNSF